MPNFPSLEFVGLKRWQEELEEENQRTRLFRYIQELKDKGDFMGLHELFNPLQSIGPNVGIYNEIFGDSFPSSPGRIRNKIRFPLSGSWEYELTWVGNKILNFYPEINHFIKLRQSFGKALLLGNYDIADNCLQQIEFRFGWSKWLIERRLMTAQFKGGLAENRLVLNDIVGNGGDPNVDLCSWIYSYRLEEHISVEKYIETVEDLIQRFKKDHSDKDQVQVERTVALFQRSLGLPTRGWEKYVGFVLFADASGNLVDAYCTFLKGLSLMAGNTSKINHLSLILTLLDYMKGKVDDPQLISIGNVYSGNFAKSIDGRVSVLEDICDRYDNGFYNESYDLSKKAILNCPLTFEYYWLAAKSYAMADKPCKNTLPESKARDLLNWLCGIANFSDAFELNLEKARLLAMRLGDCSLSSSILNRVLWEQNLSPSENDIIYCQCQSRHGLSPRPDFWQKTDGAPLAINGSLQILTRGNLEEEPEIIEDPLKNQLKTIRAASLLNRAKRFDESLDLLCSISDVELSKFKGSSRLEAIFVSLLYNALLGKEQWEQAAHVAASAYLLNPKYLRYVSFVSGKSDDYFSIISAKSLVSVIIPFLRGYKAQVIYQHLDNWMLANDYHMPMGVIEEISKVDPVYARILLRDIMVMPVLSRGVLYAKSTSELRKLRQEILKVVYERFPVDNRIVLDEAGALEKQAMLDGSRVVDSTIFSFDFAELKSILEVSFVDTFDRFREYCRLRNGLENLAINADSETNAGMVIALSEEFPSNIMEVFSEVFTTILFEFLWNPDRGLNSILSTRVRHGRIDNNLLKSFSNAGLLMTSKEPIGKNLKIKLDGSPVGDDILEKLNDLRIGFTNRISEILNYVKDNVLRISFDPKVAVFISQQKRLPEALVSHSHSVFDYSFIFFKAATFLDQFQQVEVFSEFIDKCESIFISETSIRLEKAANYIRQTVASEIRDLVQELETSIGELEMTVDDRAVTMNAVRDARENLKADIALVASWFRLDTSVRASRPIRDFVDHAVNSVNLSTNGGVGECFVEMRDNPIIEWKHGLRFYDIISTLLRNIVFHSDVPSEQRKSYISLQKEGANILKVANNMQSNEKIFDDIQHANERLSADYTAIQEALGREGGTGLRKAMSMLRDFSQEPIVIGVAKIETIDNMPWFVIQFRY